MLYDLHGVFERNSKVKIYVILHLFNTLLIIFVSNMNDIRNNFIKEQATFQSIISDLIHDRSLT